MKTRVLLLAALAALASCTQQVHESDGMTAGEEVLWMHDWMERVYGPEPENGYDIDFYAEQAPLVSAYVDSVMTAMAHPEAPEDIVAYFAGIPDSILTRSYYDDQEYARQEIARFWARLGLLQDYASGKSEYFPLGEMMDQIDSLIDHWYIITSHSGLESSYEYSFMILVFRLYQQVVRLCPDISLIAEDYRANLYKIPDVDFPYTDIRAFVLESQDDGERIPFMMSEVELWDSQDQPDRCFLPGDSGYEVRHSLDMLAHLILSQSDSCWSGWQFEIADAVYELKRYADESRQYYPKDEVRKAWGHMINRWEYHMAHVDEGADEMLACIALFIEAAAYYAEDINFISDQASQDHCLGIVNYDSPYLENQLLLLAYEQGGRYRIKTLWRDGQAEYLSPRFNRNGFIRRIGEESDNMYLMSLEETDRTWFSQCLCWYDDYGQASFFVPESYSIIHDEWLTDAMCQIEGAQIIFNPKKVCWNICTFVNGAYQPVKDSKTLYLELDGLDSRYRLE